MLPENREGIRCVEKSVKIKTGNVKKVRKKNEDDAKLDHI